MSEVDYSRATILLNTGAVILGLACSNMIFVFFFCVSITTMISNNVNLDGMAPGLVLFTTTIFEHMVHLFEGPAPRLWNEEECPDKGQQTEDGEEGISAESCILYQWGSDQALKSPIRSDGDKYIICQLTIKKLLSQFEHVL